MGVIMISRHYYDRLQNQNIGFNESTYSSWIQRQQLKQTDQYSLIYLRILVKCFRRSVTSVLMHKRPNGIARCVKRHSGFNVIGSSE